MDKVEKFRELLKQYAYLGERVGRCTTLTELEIEMPKQERMEKELIELYEEEVCKNENINK